MDVSLFTSDYELLKEIPLVDATILYVCTYTGKEALLIIRYALHVPSMKNYLIPPFIMRKTGITVNETPKIQIKKPTLKAYSIIFPSDKFWIPLRLSGIFLYFESHKPTREQVEECGSVSLITLEHNWNLHNVCILLQ